MADSLMLQFPRHCFQGIPGQKTQPLLVPFVKEYYVTEETLQKYRELNYKKTKALPCAKADKVLEEQNEQLELAARNYEEDKSKYPTNFNE